MNLNPQIIFPKNENKDLIEFLNVSKGKILTLLNTVFSFLSDKSILRKESQSAFNKYTIDSKLIQTMSKVYDFYITNFPENGKEMLHDSLKEKYNKLIKYYEQNIDIFNISKDIEFKYYIIQGMILLWLIEIKYDSEYYDDFIRVINNLIRLNPSLEKNENNKFLFDFLNIIIKFPYIKQNKEVIMHALEVNECDDNLIAKFSKNLQILINNKNSIFRQENKNSSNSDMNMGKKNIQSSQNEESYFTLMKENKENNKEKKNINTSISHKRNSLNSISNRKSMLSTINSSGFYTPEFKHNNKRDSLSHFRRFTINNINNPKTSISIKNGSFSRSISQGMNNLLTKCEKGKHNNVVNNNNLNINNISNNLGQSTKSKIRLAVQGHFYTEDDFKNNIDLRKDENNNSLSQLNNSDISSIKNTGIDMINTDCEDNDNTINNINNNIIEATNDICNDEDDDEEEIENNIVSVDELPINPNLSIISNSNSKNIGVEPENIIQETKEEEENDDNDNFNDNIISNNTVKMMNDNEIQDFFMKQFSDKKNNINNNNNNIDNNKLNISHNLFNEENKNKKKNNINNNKNIKKRNNSTNSINNNGNNVINSKKNNRSKKKDNSLNNKVNSNKSKKNNINNRKKSQSKSKSKSKENGKVSSRDKMKNYNHNIFEMIKNHKNNNNKKDNNNALKNKNENCILEPCTKGKEMMVTNAMKNLGSKKVTSKEKLPTDSVAKKNLYSLYNQMKAKK